MPREKETRNYGGTILERKVLKDGKTVVAYIARKRYAVAGPDGKPLRDIKGKRIYKDKTVRCWSKSEAQITLQNLPSIIKEELSKKPAPSAVSFEDLVEYYRREYVKGAIFSKGRKIAGFRRNLTTVNSLLDEVKKYFGAKDLKLIQYEHLRIFAEKIAQTPTRKESLPAVSTVNEKLSILRRLFNVAIQSGWIEINPFKRGKPLIDRAAEVSRNRMLTFPEEARLLEMCKPHVQAVPYKRKHKITGEPEHLVNHRFVDRSYLIPLIVCGIDTALRAGEIFNLELWQIDFVNRVLYLTKEAAEKSKTGTAGILPMTDRLHDALANIVKVRELSEPNDKLFIKFEYKRSFNSACKEAGIVDFQFRDLRSTGATRMVLAGNSESQVMKTTRHSPKSLKLFLEHYTNVDIGNAQTIGKNLTKYLKREAGKVTFKVIEKTKGKSDS